VVVLSVAIGIAGYVRTRGSSADDVKYLTATVSRGDIATTVSATGPIAPAHSAPLSFPSAGRIAEISVRAGQPVTAGQILAREDTAELRSALDQANASLAQAIATATSVRAGASVAERNAAQVAVENARTAAADARSAAAASQASATQSVRGVQASVDTAQAAIAAAEQARSQTQDQSAKALAADQDAIVSAQKTLNAEEAVVASANVVLASQVEKAKDDLWTAQTSRDAICGRGDRSNCQQANAAVGTAETAVTTAAAQLDLGQKQGVLTVVQAETQLQQARSQLANDQAHWNAAFGDAQSQVDLAQTARTTAEGNVAAAQAQATATAASSVTQADQAEGVVAAAQAGYDRTIDPPNPASLDAASAQVASARSAVAVAQANLDAATLKAPFDGTVASVSGTAGQWTDGGTSGSSGNPAAGLVQVDDLTHLTIVAQVNEADMANVDVGDQVNFTVDAFRGQTFAGHVVAFEDHGTASQNIVQYAVTITADPTSSRLLPGMTASVKIAVARQTNVVVVPVPAITFAEGRGNGNDGAVTSGADSANGLAATVLVVANGKATPRPIRVGLNDGRVAEVIAGLQVGELVAVGATSKGG
jgi:HlyD family secretion protein